jgi:glycosyltransferase involved in cell wall biosynthesis
MKRAAERGHHVVYVETDRFIGSRIRRLLREGRGIQGVARLLATDQPVAGVKVRRAINLVPWGQRFLAATHANAAINGWLIRRTARSLPGRIVAWVYDPCAAGAVRTLKPTLTVYDCVDDHAAAAGDARRAHTVAVADRETATAADLVFATTPGLVERHQRWNGKTRLVPNVGDFEHFSIAADPRLAAAEVSGLPHPVAGFVGNLAELKVDFEILERLAGRVATVLIVGPTDGRTDAAMRRLTAFENVIWVGPKPYEELPFYVAAIDVGLIPYRTNSYTQNCFPLKLYEYLAAGKPVVASGLPVLSSMDPDVVLAHSQEEFCDAVVRMSLKPDPNEVKRRMELAAGNTWEWRTDVLLNAVSEHLMATNRTQS